MKDSYLISKEDIMRQLGTTENGVSTNEAKKRLEKDGYNELAEVGKKSTLLIFLEQYKDFLVIILMSAAIISGILGDFESCIVILVVITINAILGTVQQIKAEQSLNSLKSLTSPTAKVIRDGEKLVIPSKEVVKGDIVLLEAGDFICADGRIIENASLKINESALTGESTTVEKSDEILTGEVALGDRINMVFSGSFVTYGRGTVIVTDTGMNTEIGNIATLLKSTSEKKTPLQVNLDQFGKKLSVIILIICGILFAISIVRGDAIVDSFMFAVALAVAAIPEALSSIVTIVLSLGTSKLAKENAIIRKLHAVEGLGSVSIICSDKTGTLTQNKMTIENYYVDDQVLAGSKEEFKKELNEFLMLSSVLCNDSSNVNGTEIGDPTEVALLNYASKFDFNYDDIRNKYERLSEIPFDSDRKLMSTVHSIQGKNIMITKGAVDVLLSKDDSSRVYNIKLASGVRPITEADIEKVRKANMNFSKDGLRVLAFAYKEIDSINVTEEDENGLTFIGLMAMMDPPREESKDAVAKCIAAGIKPIMITGDHKITAAAIAKKIGILNDISEAVEGSVIDTMSDKELEEYVENVSVYARVSPEHKIRIVRAWQNKGNIVAMTGDGVNDAPALKQADIGVAMGITGSEVAKDAASMILTDDNFATIVKAVENGRNVYANIKNSIKFLLSGNTAAIFAVLYASILALPVPFAPVHLLFINLLTDSLPAIALGLEPHRQSVMNDKPRPKNETILTKDFMVHILFEGLIICAVTLTGYYIGLKEFGSEGASTMAFAVLCLSRLVHGFNCKSKEPVLFTRKMWNNKTLIGAFLLGFVLLNAVLLIPGLQGVFEVTALGMKHLFIVYGLAIVNFIVVQLAKLFELKVLNKERTFSTTLRKDY